MASETVKRCIAAEAARAEFVVSQAEHTNYAPHEPTVENHRGQLIALKKIGTLLDSDEVTSGPIYKLERTYAFVISWPAAFAIVASVIVLCFRSLF